MTQKGKPMKIDEQLKTIDKITNRAIKQVEIERKNKRRNYFIEMLRYCELVVNQVKKYLNQEEYGKSYRVSRTIW